MSFRWLQSVLVVLVTLFVVTGSLHATFQESPKTASGVFEIDSNIDAYGSDLVSEGTRPEITIVAYDSATGVGFYVNQNPWSAFDPNGLGLNPFTKKFWTEGTAANLDRARDFGAGVVSGVTQVGKAAYNFVAEPVIEGGTHISEGYQLATDPRQDTSGKTTGVISMRAGLVIIAGEIIDKFTGPGKKRVTTELLEEGIERIGREGGEVVAERSVRRNVDEAVENAPRTGEKLKYHYTRSDDASFENGLWRDTSVTDTLYDDAVDAGQKLGIPTPTKVIPIKDKGQFVPNKPSVVQQSNRYQGGGTDFVNPEKVRQRP